uniref:glycerol kinase n=1 Tax=Odontella aurita TaxID=265563 RepID=A0A7S4IS18_9STRA|mmetsp:Transcript_29511/g.87414  ORF Transcript_29511/g.87414 Transcript_29511/m.87414 type:complete len:566 (+) Transcript_29511:90-1787(+)
MISFKLRPAVARPLRAISRSAANDNVSFCGFHRPGSVVNIRRIGSLPSKTSALQSPAPFVGSLDQGTSSTRFVVVDQGGEIVASAQKEHKQYYPKPGWVEHDANEIWYNSAEVIEKAMDDAGLGSKDIASIGITNQRETTVVWDKATGEPLHNAVVWNCARTSGIVSDLQLQLGGKDALREKTGLPLSTYFSATKLRWLFDNVDGLRDRAEAGDVLFGTIDCWLTWKLTGGEVHATDITNAARTLLCDVGTLEWDNELLDIFGVPEAMLPSIEASIGGSFGRVQSEDCTAISDVPIGAILGDQHAATFGQACFNVGDSKSTFGTGAFIMMNTGPADEKTGRPLVSKHGLLTTPFYQKKGEPPIYALEGAVAVSGSLIQWLRDNLEIGSSAKEIAALAASVPDAKGLRFVPAFAGLFAPHWREDARGLIAGLTFYHTKAHIARAALDAAAFQTAEVFDAMELDSGVTLTELRVDGGMAANSEFLQFLADIVETKVQRPKSLETTAAGAAFAAGMSAGVWSSLEDISALWKEGAILNPKMPEPETSELKRSWGKAVDRSIGWVDKAC